MIVRIFNFPPSPSSPIRPSLAAHLINACKSFFTALFPVKSMAKLPPNQIEEALHIFLNSTQVAHKPTD